MVVVNAQPRKLFFRLIAKGAAAMLRLIQLVIHLLSCTTTTQTTIRHHPVIAPPTVQVVTVFISPLLPLGLHTRLTLGFV
jgi:hypothetical protein